MAARNRPEVATYVTRENYTVGKERDFEDHTFCGIMFDLHCRTLLPVHALVVRAIAVRGKLGEMRVFVTKGGHSKKEDKPDEWSLVYHAKHEPSFSKLVDMQLDSPVMLSPGDVLGVYVHCAEPGDQGVVYDNRRHKDTYKDNFVRITNGMADLTPTPFSNESPWGGFSGGWRRHREFVGSIRYGVKYALWSPKSHATFPKQYREFIRTMLLIDNRLKRFPKDVFLYILNMCHWTWSGEEAPAGQSDDEEEEEDNEMAYAPWWYRGRRDFQEDDDDDDDDDDDEGDDQSGQYFVVDARRLLALQQALGNAFPFTLPPGTGPNDRVVIRLPSRHTSTSTEPPASATETTYDIAYDDGDTEAGVPLSRIQRAGAKAATSTAEEGGTGQTQLAVGARVMVNWKGRGQFYPGEISAVHEPTANAEADAAESDSGEQNDDGSQGGESEETPPEDAQELDNTARENESGMDALD